MGSIFPEKLSFDGNQCRTPIVNPAILMILNVCGCFRGEENEQSPFNQQLFAMVEPEGIEPSSKRRVTKSSTCLFFDSVVDVTSDKDTQGLRLASGFHIRLEASRMLS